MWDVRDALPHQYVVWSIVDRFQQNSYSRCENAAETYGVLQSLQMIVDNASFNDSRQRQRTTPVSIRLRYIKLNTYTTITGILTCTMTQVCIAE